MTKNGYSIVFVRCLSLDYMLQLSSIPRLTAVIKPVRLLGHGKQI